MPKINPRQELHEVAFPTLGIDITNEFDQQDAATAPDAVNVRGFEAQTQRNRGGSRPGLVKYVNEQLPLT